MTPKTTDICDEFPEKVSVCEPIFTSYGAKRSFFGIIVNGCVRDSKELASIEVGILALATHPLKSGKTGEGERDVTVEFGGVTWRPGHYVYADEDGIILVSREVNSRERRWRVWRWQKFCKEREGVVQTTICARGGYLHRDFQRDLREGG